MHQVKYEKCEKEVVGMISGILLLCNGVCGGVQCVCVRPALSCMVVQSVLSALFFFPSAAQFVLNIICI